MKIDRSNTVRYGNTGQAGAAVERILSDGSDAFRYGNAGQVGAIVESIITDGGNMFRDCIGTRKTAGCLDQSCLLFIK